MGVWYLFAMAAASIIGPWLVMTSFWFSLSGPSMALSFIVVGAICLPIGLVYGELTGMFPKTGGSFVYVKAAFGKEAAYWVGWALLLSYLALMAFMLIAWADIIRFMWVPDLGTFGVVLVAAITAVATLGLLSREVNLGAAVQFWLWVMLTVIGFAYLGLFAISPQFSVNNWQPFFRYGIEGFAVGTALMVTMYFGFELIPQFAEECSYPREKQWKVTFGSIVYAMIFYSLICLGETGMTPSQEFLETNNFLGVIFARQAYGEWLAFLIAIANFAALITCVIGFWLGGARVMYAMGRDSLLPSWFTRLNKHNQPWVANVVIFLITIFFIFNAGQGWIVALFTLMAIGVALTYSATSMSMIRLRSKMADAPRPWKTPGGKAMGAIASIGALTIVALVFWSFNLDTWVLFIAYWIIIGLIRIVLGWQRKAHPEAFASEASA